MRGGNHGGRISPNEGVRGGNHGGKSPNEGVRGGNHGGESPNEGVSRMGGGTSVKSSEDVWNLA